MNPYEISQRTDALDKAINGPGSAVSEPFMFYGGKVEREVIESEKDGHKSIAKSRSFEKQYPASATQEVFHITRPSIAKGSYVKESTHCNPFPSSCTDTTKIKPATVKQPEIIEPLNTQGASTTSSGAKWSGYRNKQSLTPVNSQTAILLPRPQSTVNGTQIQRIPVLNNTLFQFPRHATDETRWSLPSVNNYVSDTSFLQASNLFSNNTVTGELFDKKPSLVMQTEDTPFGSNVNLCRNNNSRVRNTTDNDAQKVKEVNLLNNKQTREEGVHKNVIISKELKNDKNHRIVCTENVKNAQLDDIPDQVNMVKEIVTETVSSQRISDIDTRNSGGLKQHKNTDSTLLELDPVVNFSKTSKYNKREISGQSVSKENQHFASINMHTKHDSVVDPASMSKTEQLNYKKITEHASNTNSRGNNLKERDISITDNLTDTINRVASGEGTLTFPSSSSKKRSNRSSKTTMQATTVSVETTKVGTDDEVKKKINNKIQHNEDLSVKLFQSMQSSKRNSKAYSDMEARYIGHELTGVSSFEDVLGGESDVINKVESDKLSKVKDHHLLKLSNKEREYLRNKCFLEDDHAVDVRRRFEPQPGIKNETSTYDSHGHGVSIKEASDKWSLLTDSVSKTVIEGREDNCCLVNFGASTSFSSDNSSKGKNEKDKTLQQQLENIKKENPRNETNNFNCKSDVSVNHPVVNLQRLESKTSNNQSGGSEKIEKQNSIPSEPETANSPSSSKKVYYVINSNDIVRLQQQPVGTKTPKNTNYRITTSTTRPQSGTTNSQTVSPAVTVLVNSTAYQPPSAFAHQTTSTCTDLNLKSKTMKPQPNTTGGYSRNLSQNGDFQLKSSQASENLSLPASSNLQYSNKFTVKELLQAKREDEKCGSTMSSEIKPTKSMPLQLYGRALYENQLAFVTQNKTGETTVNRKMSSASSTSTLNIKPENSLIKLHQNIYQNGVATQHGRIIHIINPAVILPVSTIQRANISSKSITTVPSITTQLKTDIAAQINPESKTEITRFQSGTEKRQPVYIKIGNNTMIVKKCESRCKADRKTLPAPKPKHSITDDYKRKRRRSKTRRTHRVSQKSLRSKLRKILQRSDQPVQIVMGSLDLVPVELLKSFIKTKVKEEPPEGDLDASNTTNETLNLSNQSETKKVIPTKAHAEKDMIEIKSRKRKLSCSDQSNMANIMQISKSKDGKVGYGIHQVKVRYAKAKSIVGQITGVLCRLKFSVEGSLEKIYVYTESLRQGLYLVQNCNGEITYLKNKRKVDVMLVLYPPHLATIPDGSLCIAVGNLFSQKEKSQYIFKTESTDVQRVLGQFLWPFSMENADDFIDKRYSSITEKSMSPRCSSRMFYLPEMKDAFDLNENGTRSYGMSDEDLTPRASVSRRFETAATTSGIKSTRFSERAMALKIKQNELFESCRRLKSERTAKEGSKKKKERAVQNDTAQNGITQNFSVNRVRVVSPGIPEFNNFSDEIGCGSAAKPQASHQHGDSVSDVYVD